MNDREAMELALDALENHTAIKHPQQMHYRDTAIEALRKALLQPEQTPLTLIDYFKKPYAYVDAVDRSRVYVAPARKLWLKEREDKEWREFHVKHQYDIPLYTEDYNYEQQDC